MSEDETELTGLTDKERYWYAHIEQACDAQQSLVEYAQSHDLSIKHFYNYRFKLRKKGYLESNNPKSFMQVTTQTSDIGTTVMLPNGIYIQMRCSIEGWSDLIRKLSE